MIDERHEELASLYALDLLDGAERTEFESALARDSELRTLVRELRESAAALAHTAPATEPPAALRDRVLASVGQSKTESPKSKIVAFPVLLAWAAAACLALSTAWFGQLYFASRSESALLRQDQALADVLLKSTRSQMDAERLITRHQLTDVTAQAAEANRQLADAGTRLNSTERLLATARSQIEDERALTRQRLAGLDQQLAAEQVKSGDATRQLEAARTLLAARDTQLSEQTRLIAATTAQAQRESDVSNLKIATLASMLKNSPQALAVAVWNPVKQEGIFTVEKMPALAANQDYQLWAIENKPSAQPVSAGLLTVGPDGTARAQFKTESPVGAVAKFAISREKKGGAPAHSGPQGEVIMISQ